SHRPAIRRPVDVREGIVEALDLGEIGVVASAPRNLRAALESQERRMEALARVLRRLTGGDEELPVARLRDEQLACRLRRGAALLGAARLLTRERFHGARRAIELGPHPRGAVVQPGRM